LTKPKNIVRVVKIGKSIELCGGTHASNTNEIERLALVSCESKGSNVYRIEAVTKDKIEETLFEAIKPYNDEMVKLLIKAREILEEARNSGIKLKFEVDINNDKPLSYKDIIFNRNELQYIQSEVKALEKKYYEIKEQETLKNLDIYREHIKYINNIKCIIMEVDNKDINLLKSIADSLINEMSSGIIFFANKKEDNSVNFIGKSNCQVNIGLITKEASIKAGGNGGGSPTFAQGGGKSIENLEEIFAYIEKAINNYV